MGFLSKEKKEELSHKLDHLFEFNGFLEKIDGILWGKVIGIIDNNTPEEHQQTVESLIDAFLSLDDNVLKHIDPGGQPHRHPHQ